MKKILAPLILISFILLFISCQKINRNKIYKCNSKLALDSIGVDKKIMGTWKWKYYSSPVWTSKQYNADKNLTISFNADHSYLQLEDGVETTGSWNVHVSDINEAYVDIDLPTYYYGIILFCKDELIFDASPGDGNCYLFRKEK